MKRTIFLSILIISSVTSFAQNYQLDSVVHTVNDKQYITSQKYNPDTRKGKFIQYERANGKDALLKRERTQVEYDRNGNELSNVFSVWNFISKNWDEQEKTEQQFAADNKLTHLINYQKNKNQWIKDFENVRIYSNDSITEIDYELSEDKFQPTHKNISVVNSFDKIKTHEIFLWDKENQNWKHLTRTVNQYKNDTILIGFETLYWTDDQWQKQEKVVYELDVNGSQKANYTTYIGRNDNWIHFSRFEEEDLHEQKKKISRSYKWSESDDEWIVRSQTETNFNHEDKKQDVLFSELDTSTNQLKLQFEQMHFYDKEGRLTLFQQIDHSVANLNGIQNTIKFDKEGNVTQETTFELNAENDSWMEKMTTEVYYYKNIELKPNFEFQDLFKQHQHNYITNKNLPKHVKIYTYQNGKKILHEEFEYFYSVTR